MQRTLFSLCTDVISIEKETNKSLRSTPMIRFLLIENKYIERKKKTRTRNSLSYRRNVIHLLCLLSTLGSGIVFNMPSKTISRSK